MSVPEFSAIMGRGKKVFGAHWYLNKPLREEIGRKSRCTLRKLRSLKRFDDDQRRAAIERLLKSYDLKIVAVMLSYNRKHPLSREKLDLLINKLDPWKDCGEYIHPIPVGKDKGQRLTFAFGLKRRTLQKLTQLILSSCLDESPYEYARKGRGPLKALKFIQQAIERKGGPKWYNIIDVENFYGSMNRDKLKEYIPLPNEVIQNVVFLPKKEEEKTLKEFTLHQAAQVGIPQGSLASPLIASKIIESVLDKVPGFPKIVHGDDILIGRDRKCDVQANEGVVRALCAEHPAGPFKVKSEVCKFGTPLDYLGYRIRRRRKEYGGGVRLTPSPKSFIRFEKRMFNRLSESHPSEIEEIEIMYRSNWMNSFPLWDRSPAGDDLVEINIGANVVMPAQRIAYAEHKGPKDIKTNNPSLQHKLE